MLPPVKTSAIAAVTALSVALASAAPAQALGRNERNFLKGVAATLIIGAILNDSRSRANAAPLPATPAPEYRRPHNGGHSGYHPQRHEDDRRPAGSVIGSAGSYQSANAARAFNSYGYADRRAIQSRLRNFGYYSGTVDGVFGPATYRAILGYARDTAGESQLGTIAGAYGVFDSLLA